MPRPSPKSLILDLLSTLRRAAMPVSALVEAGEIFGFSQNNVRVSLARLCADGQVEHDSRGRYRLGAAAGAIDGHVQSWRRAPERMRKWAGSSSAGGHWIAVNRPVGGRSKQARAEAHALRLHGFRELQPGLEIRPDNLVGGVGDMRRALRELGLGPERQVFGLSELDDDAERSARSLWRPDDLVPLYERTRRELATSEARLPTLATGVAMVESFLLGGQAIRTVALDPLLPPPIVARGELAKLVSAARRYELAGRVCWSTFLAQHGVLNRRTPADTRVSDAARALPIPSTPEGALT